MKKILIIAVCLTFAIVACKKGQEGLTSKSNPNLIMEASFDGCDGCTWKGVFKNGKFDCESGGTDCKHNSLSEMSQSQLAQLSYFDAYFQQGDPCDYFNNYSYSALFPELTASFVAQIQNYGVIWCKSVDNGTTVYRAIPTNANCNTMDVTLFSFHVTQ